MLLLKKKKKKEERKAFWMRLSLLSCPDSDQFEVKAPFLHLTAPVTAFYLFIFMYILFFSLHPFCGGTC